MRAKAVPIDSCGAFQTRFWPQKARFQAPMRRIGQVRQTPPLRPDSLIRLAALSRVGAIASTARCPEEPLQDAEGLLHEALAIGAPNPL